MDILAVVKVCYLRSFNLVSFGCYDNTEKARIEAQIKAAEARVEAESRKQRERDREAARIALQKVCFLQPSLFS